MVGGESRKRPAHPGVSPAGQAALAEYATYLAEGEDVRPVTRRNYLSDLRQFVAWWEATAAAGQETAPGFSLLAIATPTLTRYREYLQQERGLQPASVNRALVSLKRYCAWATETGRLSRNPATRVKLVEHMVTAPRHLTDSEEEALLAAVTARGNLRDRTLITVLLHTGLRAQEICRLKREHITLGKRSGSLWVQGKRNKYREVPLNATARQSFEEYLPGLSQDAIYVFASQKTGGPLTERALGYLVTKYAAQAKLPAVSPHDLRHRFGYRMAQTVPLHRLAQIMGHDSLDTTLIYIRGTRSDLQAEVEKIAWA